MDGISRPRHADLMDGIYRHQRHIYDATRKFYLLGRDEMIEGLAVPSGGSVLEIGCGTGRNLIAAARRYPGLWLACQCQAMSMRRGSQTFSFEAT